MEWYVSTGHRVSITSVLSFSMEGGELFNRIRDRHERPYTEREAAKLILMIAKSVAHMHHLDIVRNRLALLSSLDRPS